MIFQFNQNKINDNQGNLTNPESVLLSDKQLLPLIKNEGKRSTTLTQNSTVDVIVYLNY